MLKANPKAFMNLKLYSKQGSTLLQWSNPRKINIHHGIWQQFAARTTTCKKSDGLCIPINLGGFKKNEILYIDDVVLNEINRQ